MSIPRERNRAEAADLGQQPTVSVIVPCYNQEHFIRECLDSVLAQTYDGWELIVIDDASTDQSSREIEQWLREKDVDAAFIANAENVGVCAALNQALMVARGKYVGIVSGDDVWEPEKLELQTGVLDRSEDGVALVYTDGIGIDEDGNVVCESLLATDDAIDPRCAPEGDVFSELLKRQFIATVTPLIRSTALRAVGPYDETLAAEDWDMWLRLSSQFAFVYLHRATGRRRFHRTAAGRSASRTVAMYESHIAMHKKWLGHTAEHDKLIADKISYHAWLLYRGGAGSLGVSDLGLAARIHGTPRNVARYFAARAGVKPEFLERVAKYKHTRLGSRT
jgi:glycosyltransferase involved in cell wall biosynthesis